jgi:hypothetical protein
MTWRGCGKENRSGARSARILWIERTDRALAPLVPA